MKWYPVLLLSFSLLGCHAPQAEPLTVESSDGGSQLIELYTSQGCSSCPPAEQWMARLVDHPDLWRRFVPIVFHVDYWDRLGWKDPFASAVHTQRQVGYRDFHRLRTIYTPGFFVNGHEWRGFFENQVLPANPKTRSKLVAKWTDNEVRISTETQSTPHQIHVAVLGFNLNTAVRRGENAGRKLPGNFVVLAYRQVDRSATETRPTTIPLGLKDLVAKAPKYGFAIWKTETSSPLPTASIGGWLPADLLN